MLPWRYRAQPLGVGRKQLISMGVVYFVLFALFCVLKRIKWQKRNYLSFLMSRYGMSWSQPLDSATPARPPKVPFGGRERYVFMFICSKKCACAHCLSDIHVALGSMIKYLQPIYIVPPHTKIYWIQVQHLDRIQTSVHLRLLPPSDARICINITAAKDPHRCTANVPHRGGMWRDNTTTSRTRGTREAERVATTWWEAIELAGGRCENILCGYLYVKDLAIVILKGIYGF